MLNITNNSVKKQLSIKEFKSAQRVFHSRHYKHFNRFLIIFSAIAIILLFFPWTQNVTGSGYLTTLKPGQRPQTIQSPIAGRIEAWLVSEGDFVKKGDTLLHISDVKGEYFDAKLIERTGDQINAKSQSVTAYQLKTNAINSQIVALKRERILKLEQAKNKLIQARLSVSSDSIDLAAAKTNNTIAERQLERTQLLKTEGIKSQVDVEQKRLKLQSTQAKLISQKNKYLSSKNKTINAEVEINKIDATYNDKIAKASSSLYTAQSSKYDTEAQVSKLENQFANYSARSEMYYIKAPQDGYINKAIKTGIGETFKAGEQLLGIMPAHYDLAVETYVTPLDIPLIHPNEHVRVQFDGWPAIVFSGWPNASYGTYGARVVAIENFISPNGKYRVLLAPDPEDRPWPKDIRVGSGAHTIALLEDVPIWYELWRQLNGFPPNYYRPQTVVKSKK